MGNRAQYQSWTRIASGTNELIQGKKQVMQNLFIIGSPRSGTTFLASLLKPTRYGAPFETQFILKYLEKLPSYGDIHEPAVFNRLISDICKERAIAQWQVDIDPAALMQELPENFNYRQVVDLLCKKLMAKKGKSEWGDKTPHYILKLPKLVNLFPNAKYLYIVRDGRDVALSLLKKDWGPNNAYACAKQWQEANNTGQMTIIKELEANGQLLYVKYEELVDNTAKECKRIYEFVGEDMAQHQEAVDQLVSSVMASNYAKWKTKMSKKDIEIYEAVAGKDLALHGYEVNDAAKPLSGMQIAYYKLHDFALWSKHMFVQNIIDGIKIKFFGKQPFNQ
mgnify:CR=1 FL=1